MFWSFRNYTSKKAIIEAEGAKPLNFSEKEMNYHHYNQWMK